MSRHSNDIAHNRTIYNGRLINDSLSSLLHCTTHVLLIYPALQFVLLKHAETPDHPVDARTEVLVVDAVLF